MSKEQYREHLDPTDIRQVPLVGCTLSSYRQPLTLPSSRFPKPARRWTRDSFSAAGVCAEQYLGPCWIQREIQSESGLPLELCCIN